MGGGVGLRGHDTTSSTRCGIVVVGLGSAKACAGSRMVERSSSAVGGGSRWKKSLLIVEKEACGAGEDVGAPGGR